MELEWLQMGSQCPLGPVDLPLLSNLSLVTVFFTSKTNEIMVDENQAVWLLSSDFDLRCL